MKLQIIIILFSFISLNSSIITNDEAIKNERTDLIKLIENYRTIEKNTPIYMDSLRYYYKLKNNDKTIEYCTKLISYSSEIDAPKESIFYAVRGEAYSNKNINNENEEQSKKEYKKLCKILK